MLRTFHSFRPQGIYSYFTAGTSSLFYAWLVSSSHYVTTSVQFVSPLAVILLVHLLWIGAMRQLEPGFARIAIGRTLVTAVAGSVLIFFASIYAPMPVQASTPAMQAANDILGVLFCLAVLAAIVAAAALAVYGIGLGVAKIFKAIKRWHGNPHDPDDSRLHDISSVTLVIGVIALASLEGVGWAYSFPSNDHSSTTYDVAAPPARVWQSVGTATSPKFPLPEILKVLPQPVAVVVDEGVSLGAKRVIHFKGREGEGYLVLKVMKRTDKVAVFQVVSDSSPIANWVRHKSLTFLVEPQGNGSRLTVTLNYDRLLAPAWFFRPVVRVAAFFAIDVLARDTKARAEAT